ncbi:MAG: hypothetical protein M1816_004464 [Peltula sp. TS41687]|nr:MAG: hypothetical protein M1816_004464 [Peltula sp. TS41687]
MNQAALQGMANPGAGAPMAMQPAQNYIQQMVVESIKQHHRPQGWQTSVTIQDRAMKVLPLPSNDVQGLQMLIEHALREEAKEFQQATDKTNYDARCQGKLIGLRDVRLKQVQNAHQQQQLLLQRQQVPQMGGMGPNGGLGPVQATGQVQPNFPPQLQRPMQASPIPNRPPQQQVTPAADGMGSHAPPPPQQPQPPRPQPPPQFAPNSGRPISQPQRATVPTAFTPQENVEINTLARRIAEMTSPSDLEKIRSNVSRMPDQQRALLEQQGTDPLAYFFRTKAARMFLANRQQGQGQQAVPGGMAGNGFLQTPQQSMSRANVGVQGLPAGAINGADSFLGNLENFGQQQANAMSAAEAGQPVVPASGGQRMPPELMAGFPNQLGSTQTGQQDPMRVPGMMANPNATAQHQQQLSNAQQEQRERLQQAAQFRAQSQAQAEAHARAQMRAQQIASMQAQSTNGMNPQAGQPAVPPHPPQTGNRAPRPAGPPPRSNPSTTPQARPQAGPQQLEPRVGQTNAPHESRLENLPPNNVATNPVPRTTMMPVIPENPRAKLSGMPEEQRKLTLARWQQHQLQQRGNPNQPLGRPDVPPPTMPPNPPPVNNPHMMPNQMMQPHVPGSNPFVNVPQGHLGLQVQSRSDQMVGGMPTQFAQPQQHREDQQQQQPLQAPAPPSQPPQSQGRRPQPPMTAEPLPPDKVREIDAMPFPRTILRSDMQVPDQVKTWGQLKHWVEQHPQHGPAGLLERVRHIQTLHMQVRETTRRQVQQQPVQQLVPPQNAMIGQAQAGPILTPGGLQSPYANPGQTPMNAGPGPSMPPGHFTPIATPTAQDVAVARSRLSDQTRQMSDEEVRRMILQIRIRHMQMQTQTRTQQPPQMPNGTPVAQMTPQQYHQQATLMRAHQATHLRQEQQRQLNQDLRASGPAQPQVKSPGPAAGPPQIQQIASPNPAPTPNSRGKNAPKPGRNGQKGAAEVSGPTQPPTQPQVRGVKRSNNGEELVEASQANQPSNPPGRQQVQSRMGANSAQQSGSVPLEQQTGQGETRPQAQMIGRTASGGQQRSHQVETSDPPNAEQPERLRLEEHQRKTRLYQMAQEESAKDPNRPEISMDRETKEVMGRMLQHSQPMFEHLQRTLPVFYKITNNEGTVRELLRLRYILLQQVSIREGQFHPKESFTITPAELQQHLYRIRNYLMSINRQFGAPNPGVDQSTTTQRPQFPGQLPGSQPPMQGQVHPLSAANLQQQQEAYQKQRQQPPQPHPDRKQQAPPAPTSGRPPFQMPVSSPHGIPQAYGKSDLTQDKLKFPPSKKRKPNQQGSDPSTPNQGPGVRSTTSPQVSKAISPAVNQSTPRSTSRELVHPHVCPISSCEHHVNGFETAEDLAKHEASVHDTVEPVIDDPVQYAFESVAEAFGLNKDGTAKHGHATSDPIKTGVSPDASQTKTSTPSKTGQEAILRPGVLSTTGRLQPQPSQESVQSGPVANPSNRSPLNHVRTPASISSGIKPSSSSHQKDGKEVHNNKPTPVGLNESAKKEAPRSPKASTDGISGWDDIRQCFEGLGDVCNLGFEAVRNISPKDTPSSKESQSQSTPNSNISENDDLQIKIQGSLTPDWNPFGIHDRLSGDLASMDLLDMDWDKFPTGSQCAAFAIDPGAFSSYGIDTNLF